MPSSITDHTFTTSSFACSFKMADSHNKHIPTATEVQKAVYKIRESKPGLGLKKVITMLRDTHGWSITGSRLRKLVPPGYSMNNKKETQIIVNPTLPGVLRSNKIRCLILAHLLTITSENETRDWKKNLPGLNLLHVSRDVRNFAWNFFLENHTWVQARFVWDAARLVQPLPSAIFHAMYQDDHPQPELIQAIFIPDRFTPDMIKEFSTSIAVTISIGHSQGQGQRVDGDKAKNFSIVFAFLPQKFDHFVRNLSDTVEQWGSMTVEVNHAHIYKIPSTIPVVVDRIIRGLEQIREANRVTSISLLKDPIDPVVDFEKIAHTMMGPREVRSGIRTQLLEFYNRGTESMEKGDYVEAYKAFRQGYQAHETFRESKGQKPKWGSIESNAIELVQVDTNSMGAESINRKVSTRSSIWTKGYAGPRLMAREAKARDLSIAVMFAALSLDCPSITDDRRFYGHYRLSVAYSNFGDFMTELDTVIPKSEHAGLLVDTLPGLNNVGVCYSRAAQDAFHAAHLAGTVVPDAPQELVANINALRRRMCAKLGYDADEHFAQMYRDGLLRLQVPVLGLWEGDPMLFKKWGTTKMMLLALFRQRVEDSGGPCVGELKEALARRGLCWTHDQDGNVFLDGKAGVQMGPTWVVPDNTRDGLRAAGLLEDKFQMARR